MTSRPLLLTGGGDWERFTLDGACNDPMPNNWKNACRRRAGHHGLHHSWDPRTGMDKGRHPLHPTVWAWGGSPMIGYVRMLHRSAYVAPVETDRLMVAGTKVREARVLRSPENDR